jgi:tripartite-type tricarboxylate transporter receptor subunit TctC
MTQLQRSIVGPGSRIARGLAVLMLVASAAGSALAQTRADEAWPTTTIRLIVPAAPGGNPDVLGRLIAQKLAITLGRPVIVENQGGGGGVVAAGMIARAGDAHTLGILDSGAVTIAPALATIQGTRLPYDPERDFTLITALGAVPTILVARPAVPATNLTEFIVWARSNPGRVNFGSAGIGGIHHLTMLAFASRADIRVTHVPYRGGALITTGLLGGELDAAFNGVPNVIEHIHSGRMKAFAVSTLTRLRTNPDLPTLAESGFPGFDFSATLGLAARAGLPRSIVERLQRAAAAAVREPDVMQRMEAIGMIPREDGTAAYERVMREEARLFARTVRESGVRPE